MRRAVERWAAGSRRAVAGPLRGALRRAGYDVVRHPTAVAAPPPEEIEELDPAAREVIATVRPYTLTSPARIFALWQAVRYVAAADVPGAIVESGVWRGGSMMAVAMTLLEMDRPDRDLYLFDTFTEMPPPGPRDVDLYGIEADRYHEQAAKGDVNPAFEYLPYERVQDLIRQTGYPTERIHFVQGLVEETIPERAPEQIALLRLDTDYYSSTSHEMAHLFPRVADGGVLIVDDYGHWRGSAEAVDEHLAESGMPLLLHRIDYTGRIAVVHRGVGPGDVAADGAGSVMNTGERRRSRH